MRRYTARCGDQARIEKRGRSNVDVPWRVGVLALWIIDSSLVTAQARLWLAEQVSERRVPSQSRISSAPTNSKEGETAPRLLTTEIAAAVEPGKESRLDSRVSKTAYNWELRLPTEQITDPEGLKLVAKTVYNSAGQAIEVGSSVSWPLHGG